MNRVVWPPNTSWEVLHNTSSWPQSSYTPPTRKYARTTFRSTICPSSLNGDASPSRPRAIGVFWRMSRTWRKCWNLLWYVLRQRELLVTLATIAFCVNSTPKIGIFYHFNVVQGKLLLFLTNKAVFWLSVVEHIFSSGNNVCHSVEFSLSLMYTLQWKVYFHQLSVQ